MGDMVYGPLSSGVKKTWSDDEQRYLLAQHKGMYIEDIAEALGRTIKATRNKAFRMGCSITSRGE